MPLATGCRKGYPASSRPPGDLVDEAKLFLVPCVTPGVMSESGGPAAANAGGRASRAKIRESIGNWEPEGGRSREPYAFDPTSVRACSRALTRPSRSRPRCRG
jgi:hypothetical protein